MPVPYSPPSVEGYTPTPSQEPFVLGRKGTDHLLGWVISSCPIYLHADKRGMILALGAKGPGFDPQNPPSDGIERKCNL